MSILDKIAEIQEEADAQFNLDKIRAINFMSINPFDLSLWASYKFWIIARLPLCDKCFKEDVIKSSHIIPYEDSYLCEEHKILEIKMKNYKPFNYKRPKFDKLDKCLVKASGSRVIVRSFTHSSGGWWVWCDDGNMYHENELKMIEAI